MKGARLLAAALLSAGPAFAGTLWVEPGDYKPDGPELVVTYLDIGQGDGIFLRLPGGKTALIDAGGTPSWSKMDYDPGREKVVPFLKSAGVEKLDYMLISHPHADHIGGMVAVLKEVPVGTLYDPGVEHDEPEYPAVLRLVKQKKVDYEVVGEEDSLEWDPALRIEVYGPPRDFSFGHLNDNSIILRVTHGEVSFVFSGDAEEEGETRAARKFKNGLRAQVLKAGHHGSRTSSTPRFLEAVKPETVVISCGRNNLFKHPHVQTLSKYKSRGLRVFRTDLDGDVTVRTDGKRYTATKTELDIYEEE